MTTSRLSSTYGPIRPRATCQRRNGSEEHNQVATLRIRGRALEVDIDKTVPGDPHPRLERVCRRRLA